MIVPVSGIQRAVVEALDYAKTLSPDARAVYVNIDPAETERVKAQWTEWGEGVPLVVLDSPYRSIMEPLLEYIEHLEWRGTRRLRHRGAAGIRAGALVAPLVPQSARPPHQGRAPVQTKHGGHERAVSSASLKCRSPGRSDALTLLSAFGAIAAATAVLRLGFHLANPTIAALTYLLVVLLAATAATLRVAMVTSIVADLCLNYFFLPPLGTFVVADPENWVALFAFLVVSVVASDLSTKARDRAAMAIERAQLLEERKSAELARQSEALKSALLVSLAHDLRTPLTAIRVAASNLQASWLADSDRREQTDLILSEVGRLNHLFGNILEMARIDAGAVNAEAQWVHPSEIVEAASRSRVAGLARSSDQR